MGTGTQLIILSAYADMLRGLMEYEQEQRKFKVMYTDKCILLKAGYRY